MKSWTSRLHYVVFTCVAGASLSAGALQHLYGWRAVNMGVIPLLLIFVSIYWGKRRSNDDGGAG